MPDIEVIEPEIITSPWNLPCEQCRTRTRRFNRKLEARLCSPECDAKFIASPKKRGHLQSRTFVTSPNEVSQIEHPGDKDHDIKAPKR
jgi:hypothetical protein